MPVPISIDECFNSSPPPALDIDDELPKDWPSLAEEREKEGYSTGSLQIDRESSKPVIRFERDDQNRSLSQDDSTTPRSKLAAQVLEERRRQAGIFESTPKKSRNSQKVDADVLSQQLKKSVSESLQEFKVQLNEMTELQKKLLHKIDSLSQNHISASPQLTRPHISPVLAGVYQREIHRSRSELEDKDEVLKRLTSELSESGPTAGHQTSLEIFLRRPHTSSSMKKELQGIPCRKKRRSRTWFQKLIWMYFEDPDLVTGGRIFQYVTSTLIFLCAMLGLTQTLHDGPWQQKSFYWVLTVMDSIFVLECLARYYCCPSRSTFVKDASFWYDLFSGIFPLAIRAYSGGQSVADFEDSQDSRLFVLCVSLLPIIRLLKLLRRFETFHLLSKAFFDILEVLPLLLFIYGILVLTFAACLYTVEPRTNLPTMFTAVWLTMITMSTVGYGDVTPETTEGSCIVAVLTIVAALYMAIPIGIVGNMFISVWADREITLFKHRLRVRFSNAGYKAKHIPEMFCYFDTNLDGQLSQVEFENMMRDMEIETVNGRAAKLFRAFDLDGGATIDDEEFVKAIWPEAHAKIYDVSKEGSLALESPHEGLHHDVDK